MGDYEGVALLPKTETEVSICDRCNGATRAYYRVRLASGVLDFCRHHFLAMEDALRAQGIEIIDFSHEINN